MSTEKDDTDPSSPGALRTPSGRHPKTDPGLGPHQSDPPPPPAPPSPPGRRPMGVVVPGPSPRPAPSPSAITPPEVPAAAYRALASKDSVELLLEGMVGPRPDRRKNKPQTDGDASAAYHAEHGVRRARMSSEPGPKVVVERPPSFGAVANERPPRRTGPSREALSTFVPARVLRRRVTAAIVAAVALVCFLFVGLRVAAERRDDATAGSSGPQVEVTQPAAQTPTRATDVTGNPAPAQVSQSAPVSVEGAASTVSPAPSPPSSRSRHNKPAGNSSSSDHGDFGEFKTSF